MVWSIIVVDLNSWKEIWAIDFEYSQPDGEVPAIRCMVAIEYHTGRTIRLWADELGPIPPFDTENNLIVAYYAVAEMLCFKVLGWKRPAAIIDLFVEFKRIWNGRQPIRGYGLNGCLIQFGLTPIADKKDMRDLATRLWQPYSEQERDALLKYCQSDVEALIKLLPKMERQIEIDRALYHGRYMACVAEMEYNGIPIDVETLGAIRSCWADIVLTLINEVDANYGVYDGTTFKMDRFVGYLKEKEVVWPTTEKGTLKTDDDTFRDMAKVHPDLQPLRELRSTLSRLRLNSLSVGDDGRNRCMLSPFRTVTSRNAPSNSKFIFGPATWLRGLIKPPPGCGIAYIDFSQQEFAIAAVLSKDDNMMHAYSSGDPYLEFGKLAGAIPPNGTKKTHSGERSLFKMCALAVQYGMEEKSLAIRIQAQTAKARELLRLHRRTFPNYWEWHGGTIHYAVMHQKLWSRLGWRRLVNGEANPRSLANWPIQTCGAEMLRISIMLALDRGIKICAPVHDALLIQAPLHVLDEHIQITKDGMRTAAEILLDGFEVRTDVEIVKYPNRYTDERGIVMWNQVIQIINKLPNKFV